jgi:hypothetical protein
MMQTKKFLENNQVIIKWVLIALIIVVWALNIEGYIIDGTFPSNFVSFDFTLQMLVFYLAIGSFFMRRINLWLILISSVLAIELGTSYFSNYLHPFLISHHLYPNSLGYGNTASQSPEYARLIVIFIVAVALLVFQLFKSRRTFSRIFILLIYYSVLLTSLLFHFVIIQAVTHSNNIAKVQYEKILWRDDFFTICKDLGVKCFSTKNPEQLKVIDRSDIILSIQDSTRYTVLPDKASFIVNSKTLSSNTDRTASFTMTVIQMENERRYLIDDEHYKDVINFYQKIYVYLGLLAHLVWILGGMFLLWYHERRKRIKRA